MNSNLASQNIITIPVRDILLDNDNPRLPKSIQSAGQDELLNWLLRSASLTELMISICENGFFSGEPVLVVKHKTESGKYVVIEGNRRVSAVILLNEPYRANSQKNTIQNIIDTASQPIPTELPCLEFAHENEILDYLGFRHITGVKQWSPLAKARYLDRLYRSHKNIADENEKYKTLAKIIGSKAYYAKRLHVTLKVYEIAENNNFFDIPGLKEETIEFSNLNDALTKFTHISAFAGLDFNESDPLKKLKIDNLKSLFSWMFHENAETHKTRLGEVRNLPKLNTVLNPENTYAYSLYLQGTELEKAYLLTDEPSKILTDKLKDAYQLLTIANDMFYNIQSPKQEDADWLRKINDYSYNFHQAIINKLSPQVKKIN